MWYNEVFGVINEPWHVCDLLIDIFLVYWAPTERCFYNYFNHWNTNECPFVSRWSTTLACAMYGVLFVRVFLFRWFKSSLDMILNSFKRVSSQLTIFLGVPSLLLFSDAWLAIIQSQYVLASCCWLASGSWFILVVSMIHYLR